MGTNKTIMAYLNLRLDGPIWLIFHCGTSEKEIINRGVFEIFLSEQSDGQTHIPSY